MTDMDCEAAREHLDARALGTLDADEARALDAHLAGCAECAALADAALEHAHALALAVPLRAASAALKARILASAAVLTQAARPRWSRWWAAAAAAMVLVGLGGVSWGAVLQTRVNDLESANARVGAEATAQSSQLATVHRQISQAREDLTQQQTISYLAMQPDVTGTQLTGTGPAPTASGRYLWSPTESAGVLITSDLPPAPEGQLYELWLVFENRWVSAGVFDVDAEGRGSLIVRDIERDPSDGQLVAYAVTLEPAVSMDRNPGATVMSGFR